MAASVTERIHIAYKPNLHVERTQPARLAEYMSRMEWMSFCDEIDKKLAPLEASIKTTTYGTYTSIHVSVALHPLILFTQHFHSTTDPSFAPILHLIIVAFVSLTIPHIALCLAHRSTYGNLCWWYSLLAISM